MCVHKNQITHPYVCRRRCVAFRSLDRTAAPVCKTRASSWASQTIRLCWLADRPDCLRPRAFRGEYGLLLRTNTQSKSDDKQQILESRKQIAEASAESFHQSDSKHSICSAIAVTISVDSSSQSSLLAVATRNATVSRETSAHSPDCIASISWPQCTYSSASRDLDSSKYRAPQNPRMRFRMR